ncbi:signal peptidase II [Candidatus Woesearchaeota archaeon]|nr:signal peptidase II [Candidatus Woesearchaeota archaeon]RLE41694.1 MAG: signal peptidase II [Candidatus Woesearchaeota archaeon]
MTLRTKLRVVSVVILAVIVLDQITKAIVRHFKPNFPVLPSVLSITFTKNTGAAFGLFQGSGTLLLYIALIVLGLGIYNYDKLLATKEYWCYALMAGGIIGNLIDRIFLGYVVDFIDFAYWPAFNVADSAITLGVACSIVYWLRTAKSIS